MGGGVSLPASAERSSPGPEHVAAAGPRRGRVLSHPEDLHCVVFHLVLMLGYALAFFLYTYHEGTLAGIRGPWSRLAFVLGAAMLLGWCSGINVGVNFHNHTHRPIFTVPWLNRWFGRTWTVSGGWPSYFWQHAHVVVHHADLLGPGDWTLPRRRRDGSFENPYWYSIAGWPFRYAVHLWTDFRRDRGGPRARRTAIVELAIFAVLWSIPFFVDPVMALGLWLLPQWFANAAVMGPGMYAQHAGGSGRTRERPYGHSHTYLSAFFNATMFNIGYHIEHHEHPLVHWSALPELHDRMKAELIARGAHVVPFGYYRAGQLLCRGVFSNRAMTRFLETHPDYRPAASRAEPTPSQAALAFGARGAP
jgi:fatty acid desaturase